ncbi:hypothetical protein L1987_21419 [Smallanthus sonchifolius]|uniref:Uncharacterized protein n=1 Tax=Smallanthus sonchifolius TaxID=185202 RepID=A0ACB9IW24_9ASTR|nr:hypothetical protein L1987_21419 [Smallanthus sonchifolius]
MQRSPPFSSSSSMKIKTLIQNFVFSQLRHVTRVLAKAKSALIEMVEETRLNNIQILVPLIFKKNRNKNKLYIGSFRFHYNSSPSHFVPQSSIQDVFYDTKWASFEEEVAPESQLSGYLHWLEEKNTDAYEIVEINEIDDLAAKFIANCHEKFALEKQESDRRFQEMIARGL